MESPYKPPPPPGGETPGAPSLAWENRQSLGFGTALLDTVKLLITAPQDAYARAKQSGDYVSPILFAILLGWVGVLLSQVWSLVFGSAWITVLPPEMQEQLGPIIAGNVGGTVIAIVLAPVGVLFGLFVSASIIHLCLMMVGGTKNSAAGFEGTVRALAYASVTQLANIVPIVGSFVSGIWGIVLYVIGLAAMHRTSIGRAIAAVLIPLVLCCVCIIVFFVAIFGMIAGGLAAAAN